MTRSIQMLLASLLLLLLAGCASTGMGDSERLALYRANAGEPVQSFQFFGRLNGWAALGDSAVAVWTRPREAWLLDLSGACPDLPYSHSIAVTSSMNRVSVGFDRVQPLGAGHSMTIPCQIREIRPLDVGAIRDAERDMREGGEVVDQPPEEDPSPDSGT